ncbi:hypothetical protein [Silvimonas sp.]|uniref:hypothetical protein n=1 Tax=Silvimonas sp. TaxID=2650811 RepID=UPI00283C5D2C|nr:hypothetical protein [Silvimonas sp.]MDR3429668.1 hypothetical protein [Silvimonas sp.]
MGFANNYGTVLLTPAQQPTASCFAGYSYSYGLLTPHCFPYVTTTGEIQLKTASGALERFSWNGTTATPINPYLKDQLTQQVQNGATIWVYHEAASDRTLTFDAAGNLRQILEPNGRFQTLTYAAPGSSVLVAVTDNFNRSLQFTYDGNGNLLTLTDPAGHVTSYQYVGASYTAPSCSNASCYLLSTVTYPDGGVKAYHWNEAANVVSPPQYGYTLLTGISDENGQRYSDTSYNGSGTTKAVSTWLAGGVAKYTISNYTQFHSATVTDPLGTARTFTYGDAQGLVRLSSMTGGACPECEAQAQTFDTNGNVASRTDFKGNKTTYVYDLTRNLETSRTEAAGTAQARTITTIWHPTFHLPAQITEPNRVTNYTYDANGNLLTKSVTASGNTRSWNYTYNNFGQVLTATDPDSNKTTYTYDTSGNLTTLTDARGHLTQFTSYDANGNLLVMTDPNGKTTSFSWDARNRLKSRQSGSDLTSYTYDLVGQLISVVFPDSSSVAYTYDAAHRLTNIADSHGNCIAYTLNALGNRTREDVSDPAGQLAAAQSQIVTSQTLPNNVTQ